MYLSEFYYQLFQIFKEQEIQKPLKIKHTLFSGFLWPDKEYLFLRSKSGGAKQDRTADLLRARQALSQLSYSPTYAGLTVCIPTLLPDKVWEIDV